MGGSQGTSADGRGPAPFSRGALVGVIHLPPLPGSPRAAGSLEEIAAAVERDARAYHEAGFDALIVENFGDAPFLKEGVPPETIAALALCVHAARRASPLPVGVNVLRNDARAALGIAAAAGGRFIRVNVHTGAMVTDQGVIEGRAAETLRARAALRAEGIRILADVNVKHARPLGAPVPTLYAVEDTVRRGLADAVIVTGPSTGRPPALEDVRAARDGLRGADALLVAGSGLALETAQELAPLVDAAIVGTAAKVLGVTTNAVDPERARALVLAWRRARGTSARPDPTG